MCSPSATDPVLSRVGEALEADARVAAAWVFGSRGRGDARPGSDVDVGMLVRSDIDRSARGQLAIEWMSILSELVGDLVAPEAGESRVDVVVLQDVAPLMVRSVLTEGVLVAERDRSARIAFEVRAMDRWIVAARLADEYRRARARRYGVELR